MTEVWYKYHISKQENLYNEKYKHNSIAQVSRLCLWQEKNHYPSH